MIELGDVVYTRSSGSGRTSISCHVSRDMTVGRERDMWLLRRKHCRWVPLKHSVGGGTEPGGG